MTADWISSPIFSRGTVIPICRRLWQPTEKQKPLWSSTTAVLPSGSDRSRKSADRRSRPKKRASETGSDSYRSKADSKSHERNPLTETADRQRKTAAMVLPIIGGVHSLISVPVFE